MLLGQCLLTANFSGGMIEMCLVLYAVSFLEVDSKVNKACHKMLSNILSIYVKDFHSMTTCKMVDM